MKIENRDLPEMNVRLTSEPQVLQIVVKMAIRHYKGGFIYLGNLPTLESSTKSSTKSSTPPLARPRPPYHGEAGN